MKKERGSGIGMVLFVVVVLGIVAFLVNKITRNNDSNGYSVEQQAEFFLSHTSFGFGGSESRTQDQEILNQISRNYPDLCLELYNQDGERIFSAGLNCDDDTTYPGVYELGTEKVVASFENEFIGAVEVNRQEPPSSNLIYGGSAMDSNEGGLRDPL